MDWSNILSNAIGELLSPTTAAYALAAIGLGIHFGYTGLLNFGQAGFMAVGGYAFAITSVKFEWPVWGSLLATIVAATVFALIMRAFGIVTIDRAMLTVLPAVLTGLAFAALITAVVATTQSQYLAVAIMRFGIMPMFLFSATFYPISVYPEPIQWLIQALPLWHGVELVRGLTTGALSVAMLGHVLYYVVMIALGLVFTTKRLRVLCLD